MKNRFSDSKPALNDERRRWRDIRRGIADLLFPPRCVGCRELLAPFRHPPHIFCGICERAFQSARDAAKGDHTIDRSGGRLYLTLYHPGESQGITERLIYHIKHKGDERVFAFVAQELAAPLKDAIVEQGLNTASTRPPLVTYPPRRPAAIRKDGFDQARQLAEAIAEAIGGNCQTLIRRRRRLSQEQKRLNATARRRNAGEAYMLSPSAPSPASRVVILCDDLYTTGSTLAACETLLLQAGAAAVLWVTVAKTVERDSLPPQDA